MIESHSDHGPPVASRPWMPEYGIEADLDGLLDLAHLGLGRLFEAQAAVLATVKR